MFDLFLFLFCSKLDEGADFKVLTAKDKLSGYKVGDEIPCFVSKVGWRSERLDAAGVSLDSKFTVFFSPV